MRFSHLMPILIVGAATSATAFELEVVPVTAQTYALVGAIGPRTAENQALNNTLGFVVAREGVVLVGSGTGPDAARLIENAVAGVTDRPIRWVLNIGAQDHHWMGNHYFSRQGIQIIALARTVAAQRAHAENHLRRLDDLLGTVGQARIPVHAPDPAATDRLALQLGGLELELLWPGNGHFSGDTVLWIPDQRTLFSGDFVFHDRVPGIHPFTSVVGWRDAFDRLAALQPVHIVPGHGYPGDLAKARRDTGDYLDWLVEQVGAAIADWQEIDTTIETLANPIAFQHLQYFHDWHRRNLHQTYLQLEQAPH